MKRITLVLDLEAREDTGRWMGGFVIWLMVLLFTVSALVLAVLSGWRP